MQAWLGLKAWSSLCEHLMPLRCLSYHEESKLHVEYEALLLRQAGTWEEAIGMPACLVPAARPLHHL